MKNKMSVSLITAGETSLNDFKTDSEVIAIHKRRIMLQLIFCALWILVFSLEFAYRDALFNYSIEQQKALQASITAFGLVVFEGFSLWGNGAPYFLAFFVVFNQSNRPRAFYYVMFLTACGFLMNTSKMAYHEPRPFMVTPDIKAYGCSAEYGHPSGHSLFAAAFNFFFFLDICHSNIRKVSNLVYYSLLFTAISLTVLIGYARFYVGVHTLN